MTKQEIYNELERKRDQLVKEANQLGQDNKLGYAKAMMSGAFTTAMLLIKNELDEQEEQCEVCRSLISYTTHDDCGYDIYDAEPKFCPECGRPRN